MRENKSTRLDSLSKYDIGLTPSLQRREKSHYQTNVFSYETEFSKNSRGRQIYLSAAIKGVH